MANEKTPPAKPEVPPEKQPIEKEKVHVTVKPKDPKDPTFHDYKEKKVKPNIKKDVQKVLDDGKGGGAKKQLADVDKKLEEIKKQIDPGNVKEVEVKIEGEIGGKPMKPHVKTITPDEGKPAPVPPEKK